jgi:hypothetical protein
MGTSTRLRAINALDRKLTRRPLRLHLHYRNDYANVSRGLLSPHKGNACTTLPAFQPVVRRFTQIQITGSALSHF